MTFSVKVPFFLKRLACLWKGHKNLFPHTEGLIMVDTRGAPGAPTKTKVCIDVCARCNRLFVRRQD